MSDVLPASASITSRDSAEKSQASDRANLDETHADNADTAAAPESSQVTTCPPPLAWQEVLAAYRSESQPWEIDCGSRRLQGRTWGEGPPLYFLNGFAATAEMFSLLLWLLRDSFRCVVFDSSPIASSRRTRPAMKDFASEVMAVADLHQDPTIGLFGASFGAAVALQTALDYPERVSALALQHGFASRRLSLFERWLAAGCRLSRRQLSSLPIRRRVQAQNHRRWFPPFDDTRFEFLVESTGKLALPDLADKALAVHAFDIEHQLGAISCPVLLIRTEGQGIMESQGHEALECGLVNARTEPLHSTGLHPYLTHPHRVAKLLKTFFLNDQAGS